MSNAILLQPTYVLHTRSYRDTSLLVELFTHDHGRISVIARGAKSQRSPFKGILQQFVPLLTSWRGRTDLVTLTGAECYSPPHQLMGEALLCGIYLNELLMKLLHRHDPHPGLFVAYQQALMGLQAQQQHQITLRLFEKQLLLELGYALQLNKIYGSNAQIVPENMYFFDPAQGLIPCAGKATQANVFSGASLLALHTETFTQADYLRDAKRLLRIAIMRLLDNKPLRSRELFL